MSTGRRLPAYRKDAQALGQGPGSSLWAWPCALALLTVTGLVSALLGDGIWDMVSAVALGIPVLAGAWFGLRRGAR
jgi:hypothetical protein